MRLKALRKVRKGETLLEAMEDFMTLNSEVEAKEGKESRQYLKVKKIEM